MNGGFILQQIIEFFGRYTESQIFFSAFKDTTYY